MAGKNKDKALPAVADLIHGAAIRLLRFVRREDVAAGLSAPQLSALSVLVFGGPQTMSALAAAEHHGQVKFNGLPVPGATITATQGDKKVVAITDPQGDYGFPNLADGIWNIQVEMLCFAPQKEDVAVAPSRTTFRKLQ